jgi:hypothetical protein
LIPPNPTPTPLTTTATTQPSSSKGLKTKFACAICSEYGHYTHHCPALPRFRQALAIVKRDIQNNPCPAASSSNITDIRYVTTSVNERMRCPCSLCDSLTHFTYQCPMIIEYRQRQWARQHQPNRGNSPACITSRSTRHFSPDRGTPYTPVVPRRHI